MARLRDQRFMGRDTLAWEGIGLGLVSLEGEIACLGGIVISVDKTLEIFGDTDTENMPKPDTMIQTMYYAYNASVRGVGNIVRHDNTDHHGHPDPHHRHDYDLNSRTEVEGSPFWVGEENWPHLNQFVEMVAAWYWEHRSELPDPDGFPELGPGSRVG